MKTLRQIFMIFLVALLATSLVSGDVAAATSAFEITSCKSDGTVSNPSTDGTKGFFDSSKIVSDCTALNSASIEKNVFSSVVCNFVSITNQVLGTIYCGMQHALLPVLSVILTLYICIYGAQVLMGMAQITAGEILLRILRIGAIWAFASKGSWGIGMLYKFFVGFTLYGIGWVLGSVKFCVMSFCPQDAVDKLSGVAPSGNPTTASSVFSQIDAQLYAMVAGTAQTGTDLVGGLFSGKQELVTFFFMLSFIAFPLFMLALALLWMTAKIFARTMVSLLMGIAAIAFLIALSPIFLSCMLFKTTAKLFDNWLKYMVSYSLQPVITFAILALWLNVVHDLMAFTTDISNTLVPYESGSESGVKNTANNTLGFCPLEYSTDNVLKTVVTTVGAEAASPIVSIDDGPHIWCKGSKQDGEDVPDFKKENIDHKDLIAPTKMIEDSKFMYFLTYHLITLLVVGYAFSNILERSSEISQRLANSQSGGALGSSFASGLSSVSNSVGNMFSGAGGSFGRAGNLGNYAKGVGNLVGGRKNRR